MEVATTQIDKVLLTVFISVLAGFFTAALSIVKLVNDKENKTTDYRQAWTDSLRKCFADLISNINLLAGSITNRLSSVDHVNAISEHTLEQEQDDKKIPESIASLRAYLDKKLLDEDSHIRDIRQNLHQSYALTRLHFKPNDLSFSRVEQKFDVIVEMLEKLASLRGSEVEAERMALREKIHAAASDITGYSRDILKTEWEAVKKGEGAYQKTKTWSLIGGGAALFVLIIFGVVTAWTLLKGETHPTAERQRVIAGESGTIGGKAALPAVSSLPTATSSTQAGQVVSVFVQPNCPATPKVSTQPPRKPAVKPAVKLCSEPAK